MTTLLGSLGSAFSFCSRSHEEKLVSESLSPNVEKSVFFQPDVSPLQGQKIEDGKN
jgi:hypothetical protein